MTEREETKMDEEIKSPFDFVDGAPSMTVPHRVRKTVVPESSMNPFPDLGDAGLTKFSHHLKLDQRVIVKDFKTGATHRGKITNITANRVHVLIDGAGPDGYVQCMESECTPEDFPEPEGPSAFVGEPDDSKLEAKLAALVPGASAHDRNLARHALENIELGRGVVDPFGLAESHDVTMLKSLASKYRTVSAGSDSLAKRTLTPDKDHEFSVGQTVRRKSDGRKGRISNLDYGFARVLHDGGEIHVPCGELEACAA